MAKIYISLPRKRNRQYPNGGDESFWMSEMAQLIANDLANKGVICVISPEELKMPALIRDANADTYDLHLALRSNEACLHYKGRRKGAQFFYYEHDTKGKEIAQSIAESYKKIYPEPNLVQVDSVTALDELRKTKATAILAELIYHDNPQDEIWLTHHTDEIAKNLSRSIYSVLEFYELTN
ncbi:N-acetylmuramoyl-L-alanine amidase [Scatolibacter rhodanostii]|uniref:N-acetylmuramoyl-L-alanine amidase n=1 Tax=Scatolibacter rhodanostii TaxID=2014781 RepID=UPI000C0804B9|nr:N-acetylmuramoyl-L-alanine amidase [Scatolibacter rhodanostii]